jgi:uridine kinase
MCIKEVFDITIYIDIPKHIQKERWYARAVDRNLGDSMDVMFERANMRAEQYIRPFKNTCDVIISGQGPRPKYKQLMEKIYLYEKNFLQNCEIISRDIKEEITDEGMTLRVTYKLQGDICEQREIPVK